MLSQTAGNSNIQATDFFHNIFFGVLLHFLESSTNRSQIKALVFGCINSANDVCCMVKGKIKKNGEKKNNDRKCEKMAMLPVVCVVSYGYSCGYTFTTNS